jgi:polyisoprenoid-binding protein YceI
MSSKHWDIDPAHSEIQFKLRHLVISNITGSFNIFSGTMVTPVHDNFKDAEFEINIDVYSIDTNNSERDEHLKSEDFFDADKYPEIKFRSALFTHIDGDNYKLTGMLSVKDVTREITFDVLFGGQAKDGFGISRAGFEINGTINRNDFNIHAEDVTETGGLVIGEEIKLHANIQFTHKE